MELPYDHGWSTYIARFNAIFSKAIRIFDICGDGNSMH